MAGSGGTDGPEPTTPTTSVFTTELDSPAMFDDPNLPEGWYRKVCQRQSGRSAGKFDVYIYSPQGKKFRSRNELAAYLEEVNSPLSVSDFDFTVKGEQSKAKSAGLPPPPSARKPVTPTPAKRERKASPEKKAQSNKKSQAEKKPPTEKTTLAETKKAQSAKKAAPGKKAPLSRDKAASPPAPRTGRKLMVRLNFTSPKKRILKNYSENKVESGDTGGETDKGSESPVPIKGEDQAPQEVTEEKKQSETALSSPEGDASTVSGGDSTPKSEPVVKKKKNKENAVDKVSTKKKKTKEKEKEKEETTVKKLEKTAPAKKETTQKPEGRMRKRKIVEVEDMLFKEFDRLERKPVVKPPKATPEEKKKAEPKGSIEDDVAAIKAAGSTAAPLPDEPKKEQAKDKPEGKKMKKADGKSLKTKVEPESKVEAKHESEAQPKSKAQTAKDKAHQKTKAQSKDKSHSKISQHEAEPKSKGKVKPTSEPQPTLEAEDKSKPHSEPGAESESQAQSEAQPECEAQPQPEAQPAVEDQPEADVLLEPEAQPESDTLSEAKAEPEPKDEPEPKAQPKSDDDGATHAQPKATSHPKAESKAQSESKSQAKVKEKQKGKRLKEEDVTNRMAKRSRKDHLQKKEGEESPKAASENDAEKAEDKQDTALDSSEAAPKLTTIPEKPATPKKGRKEHEKEKLVEKVEAEAKPLREKSKRQAEKQSRKPVDTEKALSPDARHDTEQQSKRAAKAEKPLSPDTKRDGERQSRKKNKAEKALSPAGKRDSERRRGAKADKVQSPDAKHDEKSSNDDLLEAESRFPSEKQIREAALAKLASKKAEKPVDPYEIPLPPPIDIPSVPDEDEEDDMAVDEAPTLEMTQRELKLYETSPHLIEHSYTKIPDDEEDDDTEKPQTPSPSRKRSRSSGHENETEVGKAAKLPSPRRRQRRKKGVGENAVQHEVKEDKSAALIVGQS